MAVGNKEGMLVSSAAAGPALRADSYLVVPAVFLGLCGMCGYSMAWFGMNHRQKAAGGYLRQWSCVSHFGDEKEPDDG